MQTGSALCELPVADGSALRKLHLSLRLRVADGNANPVPRGASNGLP